jgi:hypothetical protein
MDLLLGKVYPAGKRGCGVDGVGFLIFQTPGGGAWHFEQLRFL